MKYYGPSLAMAWSKLISWMARNWIGKTLAAKINKLAIATTIYTIWRDRNNRFHSNNYNDVGYMVSATTNLIRGRLLSNSRIGDNDVNRQILQDWDLPDYVLS